MKIDEIKAKLDSIINGGMACGEDVFRALHCASQELDQYQRLLKRTRWIPVSERLPETSGYRLVVNKGYLPYIASYHLSDNEFVCDDGVCFPTHWMPLPEPPEQEV